MQHQLRMRELDRTEHLQEQAQAFANRQAFVVAVRRERFAVDVLHREIGLTGGAHAGVVESRDIWMRQRRQDVALALEALGELGLARPLKRQFQRHFALQLPVPTFGEPDRAHAAAADLADQAVGADLLANSRSPLEQRVPCGIDGRVGEESARLKLGMLRQQLADGDGNFRFGGSEIGQPALALFGLQVERLVEVGCNTLPLPGFGRC
jgi:hypothetical protein